MKPSVFSLIFRDFTLEEAIPAIAGIGYQGVELMGRPPHLPPDTPPARVREIKRLIDDHGLVVTAFKVLGEGAVDHLPAFRALTRLGYRGFLSCECEIRWPGKEAVLLCAEHEYRVLTQLIGQAAG